MNLKKKKRMISSIYGVSPKRVKLEPEGLDEVKAAITKSDSRGLVKRGVVIIKQKDGHSRARARKSILQRRKGRQKGIGAKRGTHNARANTKETWVNSIRAQRRFIKELRSKKIITTPIFKEVYLKSKGGFFRSTRHIKIYLEEHHLSAGSQKNSDGTKPSLNKKGVSKK